jgi:DNA-binding NtrC family response regulator
MSENRVLFVDDNFICNMETFGFILDSGIITIPVYCAHAAFEIIGKRAPLSALVTDIDLGAGADGFDIARYARLTYPELPVVYISGTAWRRCGAESVDASQFIAKPFHPRQIVEALKRAMSHEGA